MKGILNDYPSMTKPDVKNYDYHLAALLAVIETASRIQPSGKQLESLKEKILKQAGNDLDKETIDGSVEYATDITRQVLTYAKDDGYRNFSDYPRYTPLNGEGYWFPTPPGYFAAIEPYFGKLRPFFLDSGSQFIPPPPASFNKNKSSAFYELMDSVYQTGDSSHKGRTGNCSFLGLQSFCIGRSGAFKSRP